MPRPSQEKPPAGMSLREHVIKIIYEELVKVLGQPKVIPLSKQTIMMVESLWPRKDDHHRQIGPILLQTLGLKVGLIAADVHRPAASIN